MCFENLLGYFVLRPRPTIHNQVRPLINRRILILVILLISISKVFIIKKTNYSPYVFHHLQILHNNYIVFSQTWARISRHIPLCFSAKNNCTVCKITYVNIKAFILNTSYMPTLYELSGVVLPPTYFLFGRILLIGVCVLPIMTI